MSEVPEEVRIRSRLEKAGCWVLPGLSISDLRVLEELTFDQPRDEGLALRRWTEKQSKIIAWFRNHHHELPQERWMMCPGIYVVDTKGMCAELLGEIEAGPDGPRTHTGALFDDLIHLYRVWKEMKRSRSEDLFGDVEKEAGTTNLFG